VQPFTRSPVVLCQEKVKLLPPLTTNEYQMLTGPPVTPVVVNEWATPGG